MFDLVAYVLAKKKILLTQKKYDANLDYIIDLPSIPTIPRSKLEYPTEDVSFAYLDAINKTTLGQTGAVIQLLTIDHFTDKRVLSAINTDSSTDICSVRWSSYNDNYHNRLMPSMDTADHDIRIASAGSYSTIASEAVDLPYDANFFIYLQIAGSTLVSGRTDPNPIVDIFNETFTTISTTDTTHTSGSFGLPIFRSSYAQGAGTGWLLAPASPLPPAQRILEVEVAGSGTEDDPIRPNLQQELVEINKLTNIPEFFKQEAKKYEMLKAKGFTDEEIKALLGYIPQHYVDLASVTWGAFDHKPEHNTMLITITADNPYKEGAILKQVEQAKSKGLKVLNPPKDYREACEQYRQLKQDFPEWLAGKDNYAYQVLGNEIFDYFQVADTYYGRIIEMGDTKAYKDVPDWEMRKTINMWKQKLEKVDVLKQEAEKHLNKLKEVEKKGW